MYNAYMHSSVLTPVCVEILNFGDNTLKCTNDLKHHLCSIKVFEQIYVARLLAKI